MLQWVVDHALVSASRDLLTYLQRYSEGNPLLATQLVRMLLDDGTVRYERWPTRSRIAASSGCRRTRGAFSIPRR